MKSLRCPNRWVSKGGSNLPLGSLAGIICVFPGGSGEPGQNSGEKMLSLWKYVVVLSTILAAIITPSTDPITQLLLTGALLTLYFSGSGIVLLLNK